MKKQIFIGLILIFTGLCWFIYKQTTYTYITVQFKELRPFQHKIPVYYKGIVIGKATERKHTDDYTHTLVKVVLYPKNLHLPINTQVQLKTMKKDDKRKSDFLELIYPKNPSNKLITNGSYLEGKTMVDLEMYLRNQHPDDLEYIKSNLTSASENLNFALEGLGELFVILQDTVKQNQGNIRQTTRNIKDATGNINNTTGKINQSIKQDQLENAMSNINNSISNIERISKSIDTTSTSINETMPSISSSIQDTQKIIANTNAISCGVRQTLRKRFGGLRLIFGKTINESECYPCGH